jgi:hypothetical protein
MIRDYFPFFPSPKITIYTPSSFTSFLATYLLATATIISLLITHVKKMEFASLFFKFCFLSSIFFVFLFHSLIKFFNSGRRNLPHPPGSLGWPYIGETFQFYSQNPNVFFAEKQKRFMEYRVFFFPLLSNF